MYELYNRGREGCFINKREIILATVNKDDFKVEKLSQQYYDEMETKLNKNKEKLKELTELGKQMIAKKNKFRNYNNFKKSYKDLYEKIVNV